MALILGCLGTLPHAARRAMVKNLADQTVALVRVDDDGDVLPYCTGVWVGHSFILTAAHCVDDQAKTAAPVFFITQHEVTGHFTVPSSHHVGVVAKFDEEHDLGLVYVHEDLPHPSALPGDPPQPGDPLHFMGQDRGYYWTYFQGTYSGQVKGLYGVDVKGPFYQVVAPIAPGMSGSGVFDSRGLLVGIVSMNSKAPLIGFAVTLETVCRFLTPPS